MKYKFTQLRSLVLWLAGICLCLHQNTVQAQASNGEINGSVQTESGKFLENVSVVAALVNGTQAASAVTNGKGSFQLKGLVPGQAYTLTFSSVGFELETMKDVVAATTPKTVNIKLRESTATLSGVVVTALGIKREQKALGYAAQQVDGKELTDARTNNWSSALSGKIAGLNLISPGSGPVNSTRISLRGDGSLNAESNQALIVVDGVPIQSGGVGSGVANAYGAGSGNDVPVDFGNGIQDINPDDIESITVLKGPGATALY